MFRNLNGDVEISYRLDRFDAIYLPVKFIIGKGHKTPCK